MESGAGSSQGSIKLGRQRQEVMRISKEVLLEFNTEVFIECNNKTNSGIRTSSHAAASASSSPFVERRVDQKHPFPLDYPCHSSLPLHCHNCFSWRETSHSPDSAVFSGRVPFRGPFPPSLLGGRKSLAPLFSWQFEENRPFHSLIHSITRSIRG